MDPEELLLSLLDSEEDTLRDREWWDALSEEERAAERAIIARSIAEADAGKVRPAEEVYARIRAKYAARKGGIS
jgi:predicted transcriptional regulator